MFISSRSSKKSDGVQPSQGVHPKILPLQDVLHVPVSNRPRERVSSGEIGSCWPIHWVPGGYSTFLQVCLWQEWSEEAERWIYSHWQRWFRRTCEELAYVLSVEYLLLNHFVWLLSFFFKSSGSSSKNIRRHHRQWSCAVSGECCDLNGTDWEWGCFSGGAWGVPEWNGEAEELLPSGTEGGLIRTPTSQRHGNTNLHDSIFQGHWREAPEISRGRLDILLRRCF